MIWAVPPSEAGSEYLPDDVIASVIKTAATVELKVSDITFEVQRFLQSERVATFIIQDFR